jgi:spore coat protein U-like protein
MHPARLAALALLLALAGAGDVMAKSQCMLKTVTGVSFGTYDVFATSPNAATGTIEILCTPGIGTWTLTLSSGNSPSFPGRYMLQGMEPLNHNLYTDAGATLIWGDGTGGTTYVTGSGSGHFTFTVYGLLPAGQDVSPGTYTDTITITLTF